MEYPNQDPVQDTFEVEFSDLSADRADKPAGRAPSAQLAAQTRLSSKARARRILLVASVLLVLVVVVLGSLPDARNQMVSLVQRFIPRPTPTLPPGADRFYIATEVPWTTVSLDGHRLALPRIGVDAPLHLERGRHMLTWTAAPFQPQQCSIDVSPSTDDASCFISDQTRQGKSGPLAQVVALGESLTTLPADQQQALVQASQAALSGFSDIVQPGEIYFLGRPGDTHSRAPVRATFNMQLQTDNASACTVNLLTGQNDCTIGTEICATFCTVPWQYRQSETSASERQEWLTFGTIHSSWDYAAANGQPVALDQPINPSRAAVVDQLVLLRIAWGGAAWQVQPLFGPQQGAPIFLYGSQVADDPGCLAAEDDFSQELGNYAQVRFISGPNPAMGCLIQATIGAPGSTPAAGAPVEEYLARFGEMVTVNALAHRRNPTWPQASTYEQQLAQQLAALPGGLIATGQM